jgi:hypothetical protein
MDLDIFYVIIYYEIFVLFKKMIQYNKLIIKGKGYKTLINMYIHKIANIC